MAPTICVAEFPMATGTTVSACVRRRRGSQSGDSKRQRLALEEMLRTGTIIEMLLLSRENYSRRHDYADTMLDCSVAGRSAKYSIADESYRKFIVKRRKDLLNIIIRTIILVRRNCILQRRLNTLRAETRWFLRSMLNNPGNQQRRSQMPVHSKDSSSMKKVVSTLSPLLPANSTKNSFQVISRGNRNRINDESNSSDKSEANKSEC